MTNICRRLSVRNFATGVFSAEEPIHTCTYLDDWCIAINTRAWALAICESVWWRSVQWAHVYMLNLCEQGHMRMCQCVPTVCCTRIYGICFYGANVQTRVIHVCSRVLKHEGMQGLKYACPASPWSLAVSDRALREEHTSIQALENMFNTCSQEQPLKARTLRKRHSFFFLF